MITIDEFLLIIHDEIGLEVGAADPDAALDDVPGWDSVHLLTLLTTLERQTGRSISLPRILQAPTLREIYAAVTHD